jgi:uncharacterized protein (DUF924 family)
MGDEALARHYARQARVVGHMERVEPGLRLFFCLPFSHSEGLADQDISVELNANLNGIWSLQKANNTLAEFGQGIVHLANEPIYIDRCNRRLRSHVHFGEADLGP